jgi:hypothetical protein
MKKSLVALCFATLLAHAADDGSDDAYTPLGAERAGNADGSIPAWTGGITSPPPRYEPTEHHVDPFAADAVAFTIDASNASQFEAHLSDGQRALFAAFPDWRMNVYPTRRSASYPEFVYDALRRNAASARLVTEGKGSVLGAVTTSPFPQPRNGLEAIWNHILRWRGIRIQRSEGSAAVTASGRYSVVVSLQDFAFPYGVGRRISPEFDNVLLAAKNKTLLPAQLTGRGTLVYETIDQTRDPRKVWRYLPATRQVVRQPNFGYAVPAFDGDALRTVDDFELYAGPPDRYDWTLVGKREMYIPYNAYRVHAEDLAASEILGKQHLNPDLLRYERHRVWVVEARLKGGERHVYGRRVFYLDEDSWQIALSDSFDLSGKLWRTAEAHAVNYYEVPVLWATLYAFYDFEKHRYLVEGLDNTRAPATFSTAADPREFSPNALNYYVR